MGYKVDGKHVIHPTMSCELKVSHLRWINGWLVGQENTKPRYEFVWDKSNLKNLQLLYYLCYCPCGCNQVVAVGTTEGIHLAPNARVSSIDPRQIYLG
jgi:hypothetical protein